MGSAPSESEGEFAELTPDEAFAVLGNETRISILRTLWRANGPIPFSVLHDRVAYNDSGNFNYHLEKLLDHFVEQSEEGYRLREAGVQVIRAVLAGAINENPEFESVQIDAKCPYCGSTVEIRYADEHLTARCTNCEGVVGGEYPQGTYLSYSFPPAGLLDRSPDEILEAAHALYDSKIVAMMDGVCPECAGRTTVTLDICEEHDTGDGKFCDCCDSRHAIWTDYKCEHCRYSRRCLVWFKILNHPAVVAFLYEHAGLAETIPFSKLTWRNASLVNNISASVLDRDPIRIEISIPIDEAKLRVIVDDQVNIVDTQVSEID